MLKKAAKWLGYFLIGIIVIMSAIYGFVASSEGEPAAGRVIFGERAIFGQSGSEPLVIAHRGGAGLFPENTLYGFERATALGVDVIELDIRGTSDGELVVIHDAAVERTTGGVGLVNRMTLAELKKLDAAYRFSPDGGKTFPLRQNGINVPTLREVFTALPKMKFNIEPKQSAPSLIKPLCEIIHEHKMVDSVVVGSFHQSIIDEFRRECADVATSASTAEVGKFLAMYQTGLSKSGSPAMQALQIPEYIGVTRDFVEAAHERRLKVHVWTVNETAAMERLLQAGVDGIMTDYPDRLLAALKRKARK